MARRRFFQAFAAVVVTVCLLVLSGVLSAQGNSDNAFERVKQVQERHTAKLMAQKGVVGTAVGLSEGGRPAMLVLLEETGVAGIPAELDGVPVQPIVTGKISAMPKPGGKTPHVDGTAVFPRPVPIGVSTGNQGQCSAGTISCRVKSGNTVYALSNNHVYALENEAPIGSQVLQPGLYDTQCVYNSDNVIGTLSEFVTIYFDGSDNTVDAAIAESSTSDLGNATPADGYGTPKSTTATATVNMAVQKYGRTTDLTKGTVTGISGIVDVTYSSGTAHFVDQIIVQSKSPFIKPGDSGSLLVTNPGKNPVGLLFAGNNSGSYAIANPIADVRGAFNVTVDGE